MRRWIVASTAVSAAVALTALPGSAAARQAPVAHSSTPRWLLHVERYPGGISNGVRAMASPQVVSARKAGLGRPSFARTLPTLTVGPNVQMNDDSDPPLPQNETAVAASLDNPRVAVAAANDYVSGGNVVMRTADGGRHWATTRVVPMFNGTGDVCSGGDPTVAYSRRDRVFYMGQLCFFRAQPFSEVQIYVSRDNGRTWTPGRAAARAATNFDYKQKKVDDSLFNDKEYIAVDNSPTSPHYGRLYVTYTKFHLQPNGRSDYCPLQLAYTDTVNRANPSLTTFQHTAISPDDPGGDGTGRSANQFSVPVVERDGTLDVGFVSEHCNDSLDPHLLFQKSTDGGASFLANAVRIDKAGQYRDFTNKDKDDTLPPTHFRAPNTPSMTWNPRTGTLTYVYQNNINRPASDADISVQQSHDGGLHWTDMRFLSTASGRPARNDQFFPWITTASNGGMFAIWLDRRRDPNNVRIDTWQAHSTNDGRSWTTRRISTASWDPNRGFFTSGAFIGDYIGIAVSSTNVYPVWPDGRSNSINRTGIGETDIFTTVERHGS